MSQYITSPFKPSPILLVAGTPTYLYGSYNDRVSPTLGNVISDSAVTIVSTVTFQIVSGNIPKVGDRITIVGTANSAGAFNVTNANILGVTTPDNGVSGVVTVTFTNASTSQGTTADAGQVIIPQSEIGEALQNGASAPVAKVANNAVVDQGAILTVSVSFPVLPKTCNVFLQEALVDLDSEYSNIAQVATVSNSTAFGSVAFPTSVEVSGRFYRLAVTGLVGTGTIIGKIVG